MQCILKLHVSQDSWFPGPWFNIKMSSYQFGKSHCGYKMVVISSFLHNGISYLYIEPDPWPIFHCSLSVVVNSWYWLHNISWVFLWVETPNFCAQRCVAEKVVLLPMRIEPMTKPLLIKCWYEFFLFTNLILGALYPAYPFLILEMMMISLCEAIMTINETLPSVNYKI